jgi:BlaI family penicillinase repressor
LDEIVPSMRELEILKVLWELGAASVREVHTALCPNSELAFNTVQTQLRIMEDKGLVKHQNQGRTFVYLPCFEREKVSSRFLNKVFDGALDQLVVSMLRATDVSVDELKHLEKLIAEARREKQTRKTEGK